MLIIVKQLFLILIWLLFFLYFSQLQPPVTEIKLKRENIYVWMQNNQFEIKMWCYTLMFGKKYFNHASLLLCIYIYEPNLYI